MSEQSVHERYMRHAIELARRVPALPFGAVIVDLTENVILAEGWNRSDENPIWHGEIDAINQCAHRHPGVDWTRLTLYTTAEPCPMCQAAIAWAGIGTVVYGTSIRYLQEHDWWQIEITSEEMVRRTPFRHCRLIGGVLEAECNALFAATRWVPPGSGAPVDPAN